MKNRSIVIFTFIISFSFNYFSFASGETIKFASNNYQKDYKGKAIKPKKEVFDIKVFVGNVTEMDMLEKTLKLRETSFEELARNYYILMQLNRKNIEYSNNFYKYNKLFFSSKPKMKLEHYLRVTCSPYPTVAITEHMRGMAEYPLRVVSNKSYLKIVDYGLYNSPLVGQVIFYKVECDGLTGWISEFATDRME